MTKTPVVPCRVVRLVLHLGTCLLAQTISEVPASIFTANEDKVNHHLIHAKRNISTLTAHTFACYLSDMIFSAGERLVLS